jgi:hypothetical protein
MINDRFRRPVRGLFVMSLAAAMLAGCSSITGTASGSAPAASAESPIALPAGFPIGSWTTTITADDLESVGDDALANIGMTRDNFVRENTGTFTTTFAADGTWSTLQKTEPAPKWPVFRGTFVAVGDDALDQTTTFPPDFAGDVVRFTWRTEGGLLHLTVPDPPDPVLPIITEAHPWSPAG